MHSGHVASCMLTYILETENVNCISTFFLLGVVTSCGYRIPTTQIQSTPKKHTLWMLCGLTKECTIMYVMCSYTNLPHRK